MRSTALACASLAVNAAVLAIGCDEASSRGPVGPSGPFVLGIEIAGPDRVQPGEAVAYAAMIKLSDGTRKSAGNVRWISTGTVLQIDQNGRATAGSTLGEDIVSAEVNAAGGLRRGTREVVVLPAGTFRLSGVVSDEQQPQLAALGARVDVTPGPLSTTTDLDGRFTMYGVPGTAEIRITAVGYEPLVRTLQLTSHGNQAFRLVRSGPALTLDGAYVLDVEVMGLCNGLPPELQRRRYDAELTQNGVSVAVQLTEPRFRIEGGRGNRFTGRALAGGAVFTLQPYLFYYYYYYFFSYPDLAERLGDQTYLVTSGTVVMAGSPAGLSGQFQSNAVLRRHGSRFPDVAQVLGTCSASSNLRLTLTPR